MKLNRIDNSQRRQRLGRTIKAIALVVALVGLVFASAEIRALWLDQCVIRDCARQVTITDGKMVRAENIANFLTLTNGANLAKIDFAQKRKELLKKFPNLRELVIVRHLPDRVTITTEERIPIARMDTKGSRTTSKRVVDTEGVVFDFRRGTQTLPVIREAPSAITASGNRLSGHTLAALRLLELCTDRFSELGVLEVDASKPDFIVLTLGNYSTAVIAWEGMDKETAESRRNLMKQLGHLAKVIASNVGAGTTIWNATQPGRVFADPQKGFL